MNIPQYLKVWVVMAVVTTILSGLVYVTVQQSLRMGANDPQIQIAQDGAAALAQGEDQSNLSFPSTVDVSKTLSEFIMVFDDSGKLIASSGQLNGQPPTPPQGVLDAAKKKGEYRVTWQPQKNVRLATVVVHYSGKNSGYVLVARSLKEVEKREQTALILTAIAWALALILSFILCVVFWRERKTTPLMDKTEEIKI